MKLSFFVPGRFPSPNIVMRLNRYERHRLVHSIRERTWLLAYSAMNEQRVAPFQNGATIEFTMYRRRLLDVTDNDNAALKNVRDALVELVCVTRDHQGKKVVLRKPGVLPNGDGPQSGYRFLPVNQVKVKTDAEEGVRVVIEGE